MMKLGLTHFHLRKPDQTNDCLKQYLQKFDPPERRKIVLHSAHELVPEYTLKGRHFTAKSRPTLPIRQDPHYSTSTSLHAIDEMTASLKGLDYAFLSPIFNSISKPGYMAEFNLEHLKASLPKAGCPMIALGGINPGNVLKAKAIGFEGVAVLGSVWERPDPVEAFQELLNVCKEAHQPLGA